MRRTIGMVSTLGLSDISKKLVSLLGVAFMLLSLSSWAVNSSTSSATGGPTSGQVTSGFGWRVDPFTGGQRFHGGIDIAAATGTPVYATQAGVVMFSGFYGGYGNIVVLNHGNSLYTLYGHNARLLVQAGQPIYRGQVISLVGSTGRSTGPHLHFEVHYNQQYANPLLYLSYVQQKSPLASRITNVTTVANNSASQDADEGTLKVTKPVSKPKADTAKKVSARKKAPKYRAYNATVQLVNGTKIRTIRF